MSVLDNVKKHYKDQISGSMAKIAVPEWKTDIYYKGTYPFSTESKILELQSQGKTVEALVESLICKALDPDGKPMFVRADRHTLLNEADPKVLLRVCSELNNGVADYEAVEKN